MEQFEKKNIEKLKQGDLKTFEYIFHLYSLSLTRYAYSYLNDEGRAKDMVQEVFYKLWRDREHFCIHVSLEAFLYTCVRNECLNYLKHERIKGKYAWFRKRIRAMELQDHHYENNVEEQMRMEELHRKLYEAINSLPEKSRRIFRMSRFEKKKNKEIAREMNISLKCVEKHITKSLKYLREYLG